MDLQIKQYYNHIAKYQSKGMKILKKTLLKTLDLKPLIKCREPVTVEYYILEDEKTDEDYNRKRPFGIEVVKKETIDGTIYREIKNVRNISDDASRVEDILNMLYRNIVTPITVADILEDMAVKQ